MIIVLDVSAAIEILFQREKAKTFRKIYEQGTWIIAPELYIFEISNVLWKYQKAGLIPEKDCIQFVQDGIDMIDDFFEAKEFWKESLAEGIKNQHSIYDMFYLVLARRNNANLITNDNALEKICKKLGILCN